jgi:hypothetical protein
LQRGQACQLALIADRFGQLFALFQRLNVLFFSLSGEVVIGRRSGKKRFEILHGFSSLSVSSGNDRPLATV